MEKSTHTSCAAILLGHVNLNLSELAIPGSAVVYYACSANQKAGFESHDHHMGSRHYCKLKSPQWQKAKWIHQFYPAYLSGIRIPR